MTNDEDEELTARLLRLAGPRAAVPAERWRASSTPSPPRRAQLRRHRLRRRLLAGVAILATAAAILVATRLAVPRRIEPTPKANAAVVERVEGVTAALSAGLSLSVGEWIEQLQTPAPLCGSKVEPRCDSMCRAVHACWTQRPSSWSAARFISIPARVQRR